MRGRHVRVYRGLLRLYPRRFRDDYREEMTRVFAQQLQNARMTEGWIGVVKVWARSLVDLLRTAPSEHLEPEELVSSPVGPRNWPAPLPSGQLPALWVLLGAMPLWMATFLLFAAPNYMNAMFLNPPALLGLPVGVVLLGLAGLLATLGFLTIVTTTSNGVRCLALLVFTCPALAVGLFGPAIVLVLLNATT